MKFFIKHFRGSGDGAESPGLSIGGETSQIGVDLAVFGSFFGAGFFVICVAGGFRGGRLGCFPAFLGHGLGDISANTPFLPASPPEGRRTRPSRKGVFVGLVFQQHLDEGESCWKTRSQTRPFAESLGGGALIFEKLVETRFPRRQKIAAIFGYFYVKER